MPRIALVTGASSGLGRELVRRIDNGSAGPVDEIWVVARRAERLEALVRTVRTPVRPFCLDLTDPVSFDIIEATLAEQRDATVALLVNNAGAGVFGDFASQEKRAAGDMIALLMRAPLELTYRVLPYLDHGSRIINISSVAAFIPQPELAVYAAAKRFVLDVSRALNAELASVGITVTAVCPKFMKTEFLDAPGDYGAAQRMEQVIGFERVDKVARAALAAARAGKDFCIPSLDMRLLYGASRLPPLSRGARRRARPRHPVTTSGRACDARRAPRPLQKHANQSGAPSNRAPLWHGTAPWGSCMKIPTVRRRAPARAWRNGSGTRGSTECRAGP